MIWLPIIKLKLIFHGRKGSNIGTGIYQVEPGIDIGDFLCPSFHIKGIHEVDEVVGHIQSLNKADCRGIHLIP